MSSGSSLGAIVTAVSIAVPIGLALRRRPHEISRSSEQALFDAAIETHYLARDVARALVSGNYSRDHARRDLRRIHEREIDLVAALERYADGDD